MSNDRWLRGDGVSPGIALGTAHVVHWELPRVTLRSVQRDQVDREIVRLRGAVAAVRKLLEDLGERTRQRAGPEEAKIFDAQILMIEDPEFLREIEHLITDNQLSAERAFEFKTLEMRALWAQSSSSLLRQRVADLTGIQIRVLSHLAGETVHGVLQSTDDHPVIVFTRELTAELIVQLEREQVAGFASEEGTRTAHAAILARSLGIPGVMGLVGGFDRVANGMEVLIDGTHGRVLLEPTPDDVAEAQEVDRRRLALDVQLGDAVEEPNVTTDEVTITLRCNLDLPEELDGAAQHGAEGVGLLRTEFLILGRTELPGEEEQVAFFGRVAKRFAGYPVVVRSYDLGGDKFPVAVHPTPEANPFLGWRAIRVCLDEPDILRTQIRALLQARRHGDLQLMLPLITQVEEVERVRELVEEVAATLEREGVPAAEDLPLGVQIETPAAAMMADQIAQRSDFLSVGTNDLTQYTLAVDRGNARLAGRFTPLHPAVVRMLKHVVEIGKRAGLETSVCGEMASDPLAAFLLLGLGYRVLSVAPSALLVIRWFIRQIDVRGAAEAAQQTLDVATTADAIAILEEAVAKYVDLNLLDAGRLQGGWSQATLNRQS